MESRIEIFQEVNKTIYKSPTFIVFFMRSVNRIMARRAELNGALCLPLMIDICHKVGEKKD